MFSTMPTHMSTTSQKKDAAQKTPPELEQQDLLELAQLLASGVALAWARLGFTDPKVTRKINCSTYLTTLLKALSKHRSELVKEFRNLSRLGPQEYLARQQRRR